MRAPPAGLPAESRAQAVVRQWRRPAAAARLAGAAGRSSSPRRDAGRPRPGPCGAGNDTTQRPAAGRSAPPVSRLARGHYRPPGTRLDPLQGAALGSQGCRAPSRHGPDNNGARPGSPAPAGPLQPRPGPPRACAAAGAALTFPSRHARGPGPAESWVVFLFFTPDSTAFRPRPARRPTPRPEKPTDVHTHRRRPVQLTPKCGGAVRLGRGLRAPTSPLLGGHLTGAPPSLARARALRTPRHLRGRGKGGARAHARVRPAPGRSGEERRGAARTRACLSARVPAPIGRTRTRVPPLHLSWSPPHPALVTKGNRSAAAPEQCACVLLTSLRFFPSSSPLPLPCRSRRERGGAPFPSAEIASIRPALPSLADRRRVGAASSPRTASGARTSPAANGSRRALRRAL